MVDRKAFFAKARKIFGGKLSQSQVDGMSKILDYRDAKWPKMIDEELAYVLATTRWETGHTMQPIEEYGKGKGHPYGYWYGRGLVQLTWQNNYRKYGFTNPSQALEWPNALHVIFNGMITGAFTGKKLSDYISAERQDYVGARRIVNGTDRAEKIAGYARAFLDALKAKGEVAQEPEQHPVVENMRDPVTNVLAGLSALVAWAVHRGFAPAETFGIGWGPWAALAFFLFLFARWRHRDGLDDLVIPEPEMNTETQNSPQETDMDRALVLQIVKALRFIINDKDKIREEIASFVQTVQEVRGEIAELRGKIDVKPEDESELKNILDEVRAKFENAGG